MKQKKYWKGLEELNQTAEYQQTKQLEFTDEQHTVLDALKDVTIEAKAPRRDFLKMLGFSLGAATVAASCEIPVRKAIPYVVKPEEILPSVANYYASTFVEGSDVCSILVKTREGRPIKIEGNKLSKISQGGTSARAQASVVSLYDMARLRNPQMNGKDAKWVDIDKAVKSGINGSGNVVILTSPIVSPSAKQLIEEFKGMYPQTRVVTYQAISNTGILKANEQSFGKKAVPAYHFDKADVIVGVACDFLGTWVSPVQFASDYIKNRKVSNDTKKMSRHFQFESHMTVTGGKADYRSSVKPSQEALVLTALYNEIVGGGAVSGLPEQAAKNIKKAAIALKGARGKSLVVCGLNDVNAQIITNAINNELSNYGSTLSLVHHYNSQAGDDAEMVQLVKDMNAGRIGTLLINGVNPSFDYFEADKFTAGLKRVSTTVSFNDRIDETGESVKYLCPSSHNLESWFDAEPISGHYSIGQPTIAPLFNTRRMEESLMAWMDKEGTFYDYIRNYWQNSVFPRQSKYGDFESFWQGTVHDGVCVTPSGGSEELPLAGEVFNGDVSGAVSKVKSKAAKANGPEIVFYEKIGMGDGRYANNPFLQEMPDPISRTCWGNYAIVPLKMAKDNGWVEGKRNNGTQVLKISANGKTIEVPITIQPGQLDGVISIAKGYGRTKPGNEKCTVGTDIYPMLSFNGETIESSLTSGVSIEKGEFGYQLAQTQTHHILSADDRFEERGIIKETSFAEYKENHWSGNLQQEMKTKDPHFKDHHFFSLYPDRSEAYAMGHHWGMDIDLNSCIGCGACVVACGIENNVPVVGKTEVFRAKEMHWMRIDRYYTHDHENDPNAENPTVAFQPMMCQHCDNAPCENVCPVNASNHSTEGINQMAYNRCIGTRYCANNCPYKVRRFNWFDYQGADSFYKSTILTNDEKVYADDLMRMVLNPDVTVRSRGVMEKCSFCVQNLQAAKLEAKKAGRPLQDGEALTACQTSCPTNAITFGDMNDKNSEVYKAKTTERSYTLLDSIQVLPSVSYGVMVRNVDEKINPEQKPFEPKHHGGHGHDDHGHGDGHGGHGKGHGDHGHDNHDGHGH